MRLKKPPFFQVQWGDVITNTPYRRPTFEAFSKWWLDFKDIKGLEDYEIWLMGSFAEKHYGIYQGIPRDIDVILTGDLKDEEQLKYIMHHGVKKGFENKVLIDLNWSTGLHSFDKWEPFCKIKIGKTFTRILGDKVFVQETKSTDYKRLDCGLHAFCYSEPPDAWFKSYTRYQSGQYIEVIKNIRDIFD